MPDAPQIYLATPPEIDLASFPDALARVLDGAAVACLRIDLASRDEDHVRRAADALREVAHARDVPAVIAGHVALVRPLGLDGVHLAGPAAQIRRARADLPEDAILGAFAGASRHEGMTAGELGADYVAFGPIGPTALGAAERAPRELFEWWSEMIELPCVAEGAIGPAEIEALAPVADFICVGEEVWRAEDPLAALLTLTAPLR